jgi:hypothetical protein
MNETIMKKEFENVKEETDICFEYQLKPLRKLLKLAEIDFSKISKYPFQDQVIYTTLDDSIYMHVITQFLEISTDKEKLR